MYSSWLGGNMVVYPEGLGPANVYFVDANSGLSVSGNGLSWERAFLTITEAMDAITARGALRGRSVVYVAPGGYNEDVVTPLNSIAPFGQLIAVNPTPEKSFGATYIYASTAGEPGITVRARGWLIDGFEIGAIANAECIVLDGYNSNCTAQGTIIRNCIISGWGATGSIGIDVIGNGAPHTSIIDCFFDGFLADAIRCSESGTDQPRFWEIMGCKFMDSANYLNMNPRGFKECYIHDNVFNAVGANRSPTEIINNLGGNATIFTRNYLGGTYDIASGYTPNAGGNDEWGGNFNSLTGGITAADPA